MCIRDSALLGPRYEQLYAAPQEAAERGVTVSALREMCIRDSRKVTAHTVGTHNVREYLFAGVDAGLLRGRVLERCQIVAALHLLRVAAVSYTHLVRWLPVPRAGW